MNTVGVIVVTYLISVLLLICGEFFFPVLGTMWFRIYLLGMLPAAVGILFMKVDLPTK